MDINSKNIRADFPILSRKIRGKTLVYLDSAATAQKPNAVIEAQAVFERTSYASVHRSIHTLSEEATVAFEGARGKVAAFFGADTNEIIFVRNATEAINLVTHSFGEIYIKEGDEIVITRMEHHANFVPWLELAHKKKALMRIVELNEDGTLNLEDLKQKLSSKTKVIGFSLMSNVLGTIPPAQEIVTIIKNSPASSAFILADAAQAAAHLPLDVTELGISALVMSGHKLYGPSGIGVLWMQKELLESMPPFLTGGHMIREVYDDRVEWNDIPFKFEAGTPNITGVVGLGAALDYLSEIGMPVIAQHELMLVAKTIEKLSHIDGIRVLGPKEASVHGGLVSFVHKRLHAHDIASLLDEEGIAIRAGHHCAMPLHQKLGIAASARASFGVYTSPEEIEVFCEGLRKIIRQFA